ncbi:MAG: DUF3631 domain-containing protein, partial [Myxococcales bacterium]|nr:DUF3631 domain-containing protein [Myxococcales bacterium]
LTAAEADAIALWILHTHALDAAAISPRLAVLSPTKRCGKTTVLKVLNGLVFRPVAASSVSVAAIFRVMDAAQPTLLIDEADTFVRNNEELRGVLNAGHDRSMARVLRCSGHDSDVTVTAFDAWGPVAIAAIGHIPSTLVDRSIVIRLRRKRRVDAVQRFRRRDREKLEPLQQKCRRWALDALPALQGLQVAELPLSNDRAADNWEPLVAIASLANEDWIARALATADALTRATETDESHRQLSERLLNDVRELFAQGAIAERVTMDVLCKRLSGIQEAPWANHSGGNPISTAQLGRYLRTFRIDPKTIRFSDGPSKGYSRSQFDDAFTRYLEAPVTSVTSADSLTNRTTIAELQRASVTGPRSPKSGCNNGHVTDVTEAPRLSSGKDPSNSTATNPEGPRG